jgi:heme oxygenase (biliverdin-IX-beta and delta-forming)
MERSPTSSALFVILIRHAFSIAPFPSHSVALSCCMADDRSSTLDSLAKLVHGRAVAGLGTLHAGGPFVSMVPYALLLGGDAFVIHVSRLATHTQDMLADSRVSLLIMQPEGADVPAQALARVTIVGEARAIEKSSEEERVCREAYISRFPDAEPLTGFGDFSFFLIRPSRARFVAGFAQATSVTAETLSKTLSKRTT